MDYILYSFTDDVSVDPDLICINDDPDQCFDCFLDSLAKLVRDYVSNHGDDDFQFTL